MDTFNETISNDSLLVISNEVKEENETVNARKSLHPSVIQVILFVILLVQ